MLFSLLFSLTIVLLPIWKSFRELAKFIIMPFWKKIVRDTEKWKYEKWFWLVFNILWFPLWLFLSIWYFISWILSFLTIIWIPYWIVSVRLSKFVFLPIWVRVLTEDEYISHKVLQEVNKYNINNNQNINNNIEKEVTNEKIELSEEDKVYLKEQQIELELLRQKQEIESIKRQKELDEKIERFKNKTKDFFDKTILNIKKIFQKYKPIVIEKSWIIANNISKKIKDTDFEWIKNKWLNTIKKSNKINKKYIYLWIIIIWIVLLTFIWFKTYEKYFYYNQIVKTDEKIFLRKDPDFIEFFNNNKISIIPENKENILSQKLYAYRYYKNGSYESWYKSSWYEVLLNKKVSNLTDYENDDNDLDIITKNIWNNNLLEINSEKEKNINIYETELFVKLNNFTNNNTFYSNIELIDWGTFNRFPLDFNNKVLDIFWVKDIFNEIDKSLTILFTGNRLIWLDYKNDNLILRLEYISKNIMLHNSNSENIKENINNHIQESSPIIFRDYKVRQDDNKIFIEIIFKLNYDKIKNNDSINNLPILNTNY